MADTKGQLAQTILLTGTVIEDPIYTGPEGVLDISLSQYAGARVVNVAYTCQEEAIDGKWAFRANDSVIVEWTVPIGIDWDDPETSPADGDLRVLGFADGIPRVCQEIPPVVAIYFRQYVVFFNCATQECFVPPYIDMTTVEASWSGCDFCGVPWAYYKMNSEVDMVAFINLMLGAEGMPMEDEGMASSVPFIGSIITQEIVTGPTNVGHNTGYSKRTTAPAITEGGGGDAHRPCTTSGREGDGVYDTTITMTVTKKTAALVWDGEDLMPLNWVPYWDTVVVDGGNPRMHTHTNPGSFTDWAYFCPGWNNEDPPVFIHSFPAWDVPGWMGCPTNCYCGTEHNDTRQYWVREEYKYYDHRSQKILLDQNFTEWESPTCWYLGDPSDGTNVTVAGYTNMVAPDAEAIWSQGAETPQFKECAMIAKCNCTAGYIIGSRDGCDWNWTHMDELRLENDINYSYNYTTSRETTPPTDTWSIPGEGERLEAGRAEEVGLSLIGPGHHIQRTIYHNQGSGTEEEYIFDEVDRLAVSSRYKRRDWYIRRSGACDTHSGYFGAPAETEDFESKVDVFKFEGCDHTLNGKMHSDTLLVIDLACEYATSGWLTESPGVIKDPAEYRSVGKVAFFSAIRDPNIPSNTEWAEDTVFRTESDWMKSFFNRIYGAAISDDPIKFIEDLQDEGERPISFISRSSEM